MSSSASTPTRQRQQAESNFPVLRYVNGAEQRELPLSLMEFSIGRRPGKDLEIPDPRISRDHAEVVCEHGAYYVVDGGSKLGTYVNGERIERRKLVRNDKIEFGIGTDVHLIFDPPKDDTTAAREFLSQISIIGTQEKQSDLEKLAMFLEAARRLNTSGALDEILVALIGTTLKLTRAERGFIFLLQNENDLELAAGCTVSGERLTSDKTISHSILRDALTSASEFVITDTTKMAARESIIAHDLRTVIAIPLRRAHAQNPNANANSKGDVLGVLYLDARFVSADFSEVSHDILSVIAREAAALVESAQLTKAEDSRKRYQQEVNIAAAIQQRLMTVTIPELDYASLNARSLPCRDIGGDFFDVIKNEDGLTVIITDVSGKGISAAILASIIQGMVYSQVVARVPLVDMVTSANRFLCQRVQGEKYATAIILRISPDGELEYANCGHVSPLLVRNGKVERMEEGNVPIGLMADAEYSSARLKLNSGDRVVLVTDGITEAEDAQEIFFGEQRLEEAVAGDTPCFERVFHAIKQFCGNAPLGDDCTLLELIYGPHPLKSDSTAI